MRQCLTVKEDGWIVDFAKEIHSHLRRREQKRFPFKSHTTQLKLRPQMIKFMKSICTEKRFCTPAQHLAVCLMDMFMDEHFVEINHWHLFVVGCLSIAVKLEENGDLIPSNKNLCKFLDAEKYIPSDIMHVEVAMLTFFNWDVMFPTVAHFVEYYELYALAPSSDVLCWGKSNYELLKTQMHQYIEYFLNEVLENTTYYDYTPSIIAASCIASARVHLNLKPMWTVALSDVTRYRSKDLRPCINLLLSEFEKDIENVELENDQQASLKQTVFPVQCLEVLPFESVESSVRAE